MDLPGGYLWTRLEVPPHDHVTELLLLGTQDIFAIVCSILQSHDQICLMLPQRRLQNCATDLLYDCHNLLVMGRFHDGHNWRTTCTAPFLAIVLITYAFFFKKCIYLIWMLTNSKFIQGSSQYCCWILELASLDTKEGIMVIPVVGCSQFCPVL